MISIVGKVAVVAVVLLLVVVGWRIWNNDVTVVSSSCGFEDASDLEVWRFRHVHDPTLGEMDWAISRTDDEAYAGEWSVMSYQDAMPTDDGVNWIETTYRLEPNTRYYVTASCWIKSEVEGGIIQWKAVGFIGGQPPEVEADFRILGDADRTTDWERFDIEGEVLTQEDGTVTVAFGISVTWETPRTHWLDEVTILIEKNAGLF